MAADPSIVERVARQAERVHVSIGAVCNNNCIFCMEEDRDGRYVNNSAMTAERVRWILEENRGAEEVCFTSGEPTTRPELPDLVAEAKRFGYRRISIMTNGRRLSHMAYAALLAKAGMNRFYVSIHGHTKKLHEGLTRTPESFEQTVAGLETIAKLKRFGIEVHTSTVVTDRNLPHLLDIYRFLRARSVDQVVFNVMQANGRADTYFDQIFPRYTEIAAGFRKFCDEVGEERPQAFLVDIPLCTTEAIPDFNRGYVEKYRHFDLAEQAALKPAQAAERAQEGRGRGLVLVTREDLDDEQRDKRAECAGCRYNAACEGVWRNYLKRYGWDEMQPVAIPAVAVANLGYIQVVRHCNHFCGFCSNPATPYVHTFESMKVLVDDLVARKYFGVILTGGEPSLHPELPRIASYASSRGLHVRMITNGHRLADAAFAREMADAGLELVHVSVYSVRPEVEARLRGVDGTLERAFASIENAHAAGVQVNVNCVINKLNADHLDENIAHFTTKHPYVRHFIWNNLDPSMGRAEVNQAQFTPRLADFEASLHRAMRRLHESGRTFRVEKVPLCYMTDFAWASTETRKIVKGEERVVHFLDDKQTVRQTEWEHIYAPACAACSLRAICGGLFDRGAGYDPAELAPVFVSRDAIVESILNDPLDPSFERRSVAEWNAALAAAARPATADAPPPPVVGEVTEQGIRLYEAKRRAEQKKAEALGVAQEKRALPVLSRDK